MKTCIVETFKFIFSNDFAQSFLLEWFWIWHFTVSNLIGQPSSPQAPLSLHLDAHSELVSLLQIIFSGPFRKTLTRIPCLLIRQRRHDSILRIATANKKRLNFNYFIKEECLFCFPDNKRPRNTKMSKMQLSKIFLSKNKLEQYKSYLYKDHLNLTNKRKNYILQR